MFRCGKALLALTIASASAWSQSPPNDRPPVVSSQPDAAEAKARKAQELFGQAVAAYRDDRLLDAISSLDECLKLDADAIPPRKLLATLLVAVGRDKDAIEQLTKITAVRPDDFDAWERYANLLHDRGEPKAARTALQKAVATTSIRQNPESWLLLLHRLSTWSERAQDYTIAEKALRELVGVLDDKQDAIRKLGLLTLVEIKQEKADALERLGDACLHNNKLDEAQSAYTEAAKLIGPPTDANDAARIGRLHWRQARLADARAEPAAALEHLRMVLKRRPSTAEPYQLFVKLMNNLDRKGAITAELEAFAKADPKNTGLQLLLSDQYAAAGRIDDVLKLFAALLEAGPKPELYRALFQHLEKANEFSRVLKVLDDRLAVAEDKSKPDEERGIANAHARAMYGVLRQRPALIRALLPLAWEQQVREFRKFNLNYRTYEALGRLAARSGELPEAEKLLRESLRYVPRRFDGATVEALIQVLLAQKKYRDVIQLCEARILESDDNQFMYHYYQVMPLARIGNIAQALEVNKTAIQLGADRNRFITRLQRLEVLRFAGKFDEAVTECEAVLKENTQKKETRDAMRTLSSLYAAKGDRGLAEQLLRKLHDSDPNDAGVCNDLGYQLAEQNRSLDEAERLVRRALELDRAEKNRAAGEDEDADDLDDNPAYLDSLGWVLFRRGKTAEARRILEKAVAHPDVRDDVAIWDHFGDVCFRLGDTIKAREAWSRAKKNAEEEQRIRKDGRFDEIQRKLQVLPDK